MAKLQNEAAERAEVQQFTVGWPREGPGARAVINGCSVRSVGQLRRWRRDSASARQV